MGCRRVMRRLLGGVALALGLGGTSAVLEAQLPRFAGDSIQRSLDNTHRVTVIVTGVEVGRRLLVTREVKFQPGLEFVEPDFLLRAVDTLEAPSGEDSVVVSTASDPAGIWRYRLLVDSLGTSLVDQMFVRAGEISAGTQLFMVDSTGEGFPPRVDVRGVGIPGLVVTLAACAPGCTRLGDTTVIGADERFTIPRVGFPVGGSQEILVTARDEDGWADSVVAVFQTQTPLPPAVFIRSPVGIAEPGPGIDTVRVIAGDSLLFAAQSGAEGGGEIVRREWSGITPGAGTDSAGVRVFTDPGRYVVVFRAEDDLGLASADTVIVEVRPRQFVTIDEPSGAVPIPLEQPVRGRSLPGSEVFVSCARCSPTVVSSIAGADSVWSVGTVTWTSREPDTLRVLAIATSGDTATARLALTFEVPITPFVEFTAPDEGAALTGRAVVAGRAFPGSTVQLACGTCDHRDSVRTAAADSTWSFGLVRWRASGVDTLRAVAVAPNAVTTEAQRVVVVSLTPPTVFIRSPVGVSEPGPDRDSLDIVTGDTLAFVAQSAVADGAEIGAAIVRRLWRGLVPGASTDSAGTRVFATAGRFVVSFEAEDDLGQVSADTVIVSVRQRPLLVVNSPTAGAIVEPTLRVTGRALPGATVRVRCGRCSPADSSALAAADSAWAFDLRWTTPGADTLRLTAATDRDTLAAVVPVTVLSANRPPTIVITAPTAGATVAVGDTLTFAATVADPDGDTPLAVTWQLSPTDSVTGTTTFPFVFRTAGSRTVTATVRDPRGGVGTASVTITVTGRGPNVDRTARGSATRVDGHDVLFVLRRLGTTDVAADVNGDGVVDAADLALVRAAFGRRTP